MARQAIVVAVVGAAIAVGVFTLHVVQLGPAYSFAGSSTAGAVALLAAGWALIAAGLAYTLRRSGSRFGPLLVGAGFAWFLLEGTNPETGSALAFTIGLCLYAACPPLVGHAVLAYPEGRLTTRVEYVTVAVAYVGGIFVLGLLPSLLFDGRAQACGCPGSLVLVSNQAQAADDIRRAGLYLGAAWAVALAILALGKLVGATRSGRRPSWPVFAAGATYLGAVAVTFVGSFSRGILWNGTLERRVWFVEAIALTVLSAAVGWQIIRVRRARTTVARLVVDLARSQRTGGLRDVLAAIVGDPDLSVGYPVQDRRGLVDAAGSPVEISAHTAQTSLVRDGQTVAVLGHAAGLFDDRQLTEEVTAACRLTLENERLQAAAAVRLDELRASRSRIVAGADAERKRLERDLHDGAQQRLVTLSLSLRLLRQQLAGADTHVLARIDEAEKDLETAISQLRELAHGIFPSVLADGGLLAAISALAEDGAVPIVVTGLPAGRYPPAVEAAAYSVVAEVARTSTSGLSIRGGQAGDLLVVEVDATEEPDRLDWLAVEDRLGAIEGQLRVDRRNDGRPVTIRMELPCGS